VANGGTGLTAVTAHDLMIGNGTSALTLLAPSSTSGVPLISQGASSNPAYGTAVVAGGGTGATTLTSNGVLLGNGTSAVSATTAGTNGQLLIGGTSAAPAFATVTTSTGVNFTTGSNTLAIDVKSAGYAVNAVSGTSGTLAAQNMYVLNASGQTTMALPATASVGDTIQVLGSALNTGGFIVSQASGQIIYGPGGHSTSGATGKATSAAAAAQSVTLVCVVANTTFVIVANSGTITLS